MRTNVEIDEDMLLRCKRLTGLRTNRAVIDEALRTVLRLHGQREVRDLRGRLRWEDPAAPAPPAAPRSLDEDPR